MHGGGLIAEGGYGCIFHPELNCRGKEIKGKKGEKYVTKLQRNDFSAENEILIGGLIRQAKDSKRLLEYNFAPVLQNCTVGTSTLGSLGSSCIALRKKDASEFRLMRIRYINSVDLDNFIINNNNSSFILSTLIASFNHLLKSIRLLIGLEIVHNDLKGQNIIYDKDKALPVIIDFGLSLPMSKITSDNLYNYFYVYAPEYYIWPLEVHFLNLLLHVSPEPTDSMLHELAGRYVHQNAALTPFSQHFKKRFEKLCFSQLKKYAKMDRKGRKTKIIQAWHTWDNYSLSIIYLKFICFIMGSENGDILQSTFVVFILKLLLTNIHPDPSQRFDINKTLETFNQFLLNEKVDKIVIFEDILENINRNKGYINRKIATAKATLRTLSQMTLRQAI